VPVFDEIKSSLKDFIYRLSHESRRTAILAKLRFELKGLDYKRREAYARLGEKLYDLYKRKVVKDEILNEALFEQFEELEDIEKRAVELLEDIQKITLMEYQKEMHEESAKNPVQENKSSDETPELIESATDDKEINQTESKS